MTLCLWLVLLLSEMFSCKVWVLLLSAVSAAADTDVAVVTTLVTIPELTSQSNRITSLQKSRSQLMAQAAHLGRTLDSVGSVIPRVAITAGLRPTELNEIRDVGFCVVDFSRFDPTPFYQGLRTRQTIAGIRHDGKATCAWLGSSACPHRKH